jgi:hypothetical protein
MILNLAVAAAAIVHVTSADGVYLIVETRTSRTRMWQRAPRSHLAPTHFTEGLKNFILVRKSQVQESTCNCKCLRMWMWEKVSLAESEMLKEKGRTEKEWERRRDKRNIDREREILRVREGETERDCVCVIECVRVQVTANSTVVWFQSMVGLLSVD